MVQIISGNEKICPNSRRIKKNWKITLEDFSSGAITIYYEYFCIFLYMLFFGALVLFMKAFQKRSE